MSQAKASGWEQSGGQMGREELLGKEWQSQDPSRRAKALGLGVGDGKKHQRGQGGTGRDVVGL